MMEAATLFKIITTIRNHKGLARDCLTILKKDFPEQSHDTLFSILSLEHQKRMKMHHNKSEATKNRYYNMYNRAIQKGHPPGIILRIAEEVDVAACLVARLILRKYYEEHPHDLPDSHHHNINVNVYLKDTSLIQNMDLSYEVYLCTIYDILYSPLTDTMKHSLGQQYEIQLLNTIAKLGFAFKDEEQLRRTGYDKTPDVKLEVPVAINGFIVNWIESKALFGEETVHKEYMKNQYLSYWNRFGTGLIIYWFGFSETIIDPNEKRFMIKTDVPTQNITHIIPPKIENSIEDKRGNTEVSEDI